MRRITVNGATALYAIMGSPIKHAMSPVIVNTFFDAMDMDKVLVALEADLDTFDRVMDAAKTTGFEGYVFTMPVKERAVTHMDAMSEDAAIIGAVNCAKNDNGAVVGHNTDSIGFWNAVRAKRDAPIDKALVLGAGGFARAAVAQLAIQGVRDIVVANRLDDAPFVESFRKFMERLGEKYPDADVRLVDWNPDIWAKELPGCGVVANGTPNGMMDRGDLHEIFPYNRTARDTVFFDAIYEPRFTRFLARAKTQGSPVAEGLDLLAHQGAVSFDIWTGKTVRPEDMKNAAAEFMAARG